MPAEWPLVGRRQELGFVERAIEDPDRRGVLLAGAPGVGKTRLAQEALRAAESRGWHVETIYAAEATSDVPFGSMAHLLSRSERASRPPADLMQEIAGNLVGRAADARIVLGVDDAHLLDRLSAAFVHHVAVIGAASVVITLRSGAPPPETIMSLYKDGLADRLELQQLARDEVHHLLFRVLDGEVAEQTLTELWAASGGNVFYLRELVLDALDAGTLVERNGVWRWSGGIGPGTRLSEVVGSHLADLGSGEAELVELLALGEPLDMRLVERTVSPAVLPALERRGLISIGMSGPRIEVRLGHPIYGEVVRARLTAYQRRQLYGVLAERLNETGCHRPGDLVRLSLWSVESGTARDAGQLAASAEYANRIADPLTAERLARASLHIGVSFAASLQLGAALVEQGRFEEAEKALGGLCAAVNHDGDRKALAYYRMRALFYGLGRPEAAERAVEASENAMGEGPARDTLRGWRMMMLSHRGRFAEAATLAVDLVDSDDERARLNGMSTIATARLLSGQVVEAASLTDKCLLLADRQGSIPITLSALRVLTLISDGRLAEADELVSTLCPLDTNDRFRPGYLAVATTLQGNVRLAQGRPQTAIRLLRDAAALLRDLDAGGFLAWCMSLEIEAAMLLGDWQSARSLLVETTHVQTHAGVQLFDGACARAQAWGSGVEGTWSLAVPRLTKVADQLLANGEVAEAVHCLHDAVRLGGGPEIARRLVEVATHADGGLIQAALEHAHAILTNDHDALEGAATRFEQAGCILLAAEAAAQAGDVAARGGLRQRASAARRWATELAARCEGACPPIIAGLTEPDGLTRRESEIAHLAAMGLTNRQIADRLVTSVRTVEGHLYQAYAKLGVSNRSALINLLSEDRRGLGRSDSILR